jgi:UDP-N-acetylglucosamine 2-epimerase (non-hydrolysing)
VVFPVHPRTAKVLETCSVEFRNILMVEPLGYLEFIHLVRDAKGVVTDSGGISEETTVLGIPCLTLRTTTERPETVTMGTNELIGTDPSAIPPNLKKILAGEWKTGGIPPLWDGKCSERIIHELESLLR